MKKEFYDGMLVGGILALLTYAISDMFNFGGLSVFFWLLEMTLFLFVNIILEKIKERKRKK